MALGGQFEAANGVQVALGAHFKDAQVAKGLFTLGPRVRLGTTIEGMIVE